MHLFSNLPVATHAFKHWHTDDIEIDVFIVKARFQRDVEDNFRSVPLDELALEDVFEGDPGKSALICEQDIAPGKAATDLLVKAVARSPSGSAMPDWPVRIEVLEHLSYGFHVRGPCQWTRNTKTWSLGKAMPVLEVPITYALAYGGRAVDEDETEVFHEFNPAGKGFTTPASRTASEPIDAPQIGELAEFLAADIEAVMTVHGFGPIAKAWLPRRRLAGTFDEAWKKQRHPRMPHDYSLGFWNCAPLALQMPSGLTGKETILLHGISSRRDPVPVQLPGVGMLVAIAGEPVRALALDTVALDLSSDAPENHTIDLTWRGFQKSVASECKGEIQHYLIEN